MFAMMPPCFFAWGLVEKKTKNTVRERETHIRWACEPFTNLCLLASIYLLTNTAVCLYFARVKMLYTCTLLSCCANL